ncbi:MAG: response regulator [Oscillospiraceae bacterium]|jgi:two-component system response regulator (stage 0 sporulation protein A)|nr:response regulator [Oscillospiraceae bacterium]
MDEMMRVLVAEGCAETRDALDAALSLHGFAVYTARDGGEAMAAIEQLSPDALVLAMALPRLDGLDVLRALNGRALPRYPFTVAISAMGGDVLAKATAIGADAAFAKPVMPEALIACLSAVPDGPPPRIARWHAARRQALARRELDDMGMSRSIKGYAYLAQAICLASVEPGLLRQMMKRFYPLLAQDNNTTISIVERSIRHAIESTWTRGRMEALHRVFGNSIDPQRGKPTNTECIARLAQKVVV